MKNSKLKILTALTLIFILFTSTGGLILSLSIPDNAVITPDETNGRWLPKHVNWILSTKESPSEAVWQNNAQKLDSSDNKLSATVYLCGLIPIKNVEISIEDNMTVMLGGQTVGINLRTDGILVVGTAPIDTGSNNFSPAEQSGIRQGDIIKSVNGTDVRTTEDVTGIIKKSGDVIHISGKRDGNIMSWQVVPCIDANGNKKIGMWIRDTVAGIGTLTFCTDQCFGALGHPISDIDTGKFVPAGGGDIFSASVIGIDKGEKGVPGSLKGLFSGNKIGEIKENSECGVFGINKTADGEEISVAKKNEVKCREAYIRCDIGDGPENFDAKIIRILPASEGNKGMVIEITDKKLLDSTGGIVQGMSGSPIIQNGRIVGAVTHVFVNDPTRGYGIFIENMLAEAEKIR